VQAKRGDDPLILNLTQAPQSYWPGAAPLTPTTAFRVSGGLHGIALFGPFSIFGHGLTNAGAEYGEFLMVSRDRKPSDETACNAADPVSTLGSKVAAWTRSLDGFDSGC
jgi:hypothetical protein